MPPEPDPRDRPPRALEPITAGLADATHHGYRALEGVIGALRESVGIRARAAEAGRAGGRPSGSDARTADRGDAAQGASAPGRGRAFAGGEVVTDLAHIAADLIARAGDLAHDVARIVADLDQAGAGPREADDAAPVAGTPAVLELEAIAGEPAAGTFMFWNTTPVALRGVEVVVTDLFGPSGIITAEHITVAPERVASVRSAAPVEFSISVDTTDAAPGDYRSLAQAEPGGACVVLQLKVRAGNARTDEAPIPVPPAG